MVTATASDGRPNTSVRTKLNYYVDRGSVAADPSFHGTSTETGREYAEVTVNLKDARGHEGDFHVDKQGFQLLTNSSAEKVFDNNERIQEMYHPECSRLLRRITGATRVHVMDHMIRRQPWGRAIDGEKDLDDMIAMKHATTAQFVHVDVCRTVVRDPFWTRIFPTSVRNSPNRGGMLAWAIINVWRAIETVHREALCLCDARSLTENELLERSLGGALDEEVAQVTPLGPLSLQEEVAQVTPLRTLTLKEEVAQVTPVGPLMLKEQVAQVTPVGPLTLKEEVAQVTPVGPLGLKEEASVVIPLGPLTLSEAAVQPLDAGRRLHQWSVEPPLNPDQHKWYYFSQMTSDEVLLIKIFDSKKDGTARRTPHTAFITSEDFGPPRQSLEVRCLVFWEGQCCE